MFNEDNANSLATDKPVALGFRIELEFGNVGFFHGEVKTGVPGKKPLVARREPTTNTTQIYDTVYRNRTQATLVGGERSHHYANLGESGPCRVDYFSADQMD